MDAVAPQQADGAVSPALLQVKRRPVLTMFDEASNPRSTYCQVYLCPLRLQPGEGGGAAAARGGGPLPTGQYHDHEQVIDDMS